MRAHGTFLLTSILIGVTAKTGECMPSFWTFVLYTSQSIGTLGNKWHEKVKFSDKNGCSPGGWELAGFQAFQLFHGWSLVWLFLNSITAYELQLQDSRLLPAQCPLSCLSSLKCSGSGQFSRTTISRNLSIYDCLLTASCFPESAGIWYPLFSLTLQTGWNDRWKRSRTELWVSALAFHCWSPGFRVFLWANVKMGLIVSF